MTSQLKRWITQFQNKVPSIVGRINKRQTSSHDHSGITVCSLCRWFLVDRHTEGDHVKHYNHQLSMRCCYFFFSPAERAWVPLLTAYRLLFVDQRCLVQKGAVLRDLIALSWCLPDTRRDKSISPQIPIKWLVCPILCFAQNSPES